MTTEAKLAPSLNGTIKISRRGRQKFQFGDDDEPFEVDVIEVYDRWYEVDWLLRDEKGEYPNSKQDEYSVNRLNFVQSVVNEAYAKVQKPAPQLSRAEAEAFIDEIRKAASVLRNFTSPKGDEPSSSPASSQTRIVFDQ